MEVIIFLFWFGFAAVVGVAANSRGRSGPGWAILAIIISPLLAGLFLLALPRLDSGAMAEQNQMLFDAMSDEEKQRVIKAREKREFIRQVEANQRARVHRFIAIGFVLILIFAAFIVR